ncbi:hypothetical protein BMETH_1312_0 [methanotrophic bacterial endosymbiont of Bathymodiolus sp.]|nr:hypothetical protein BMETH_1312_0 [methanotrophic bacterial endosymbiont of Bathymodiolus sp.]
MVAVAFVITCPLSSYCFIRSGLYRQGVIRYRPIWRILWLQSHFRIRCHLLR